MCKRLYIIIVLTLLLVAAICPSLGAQAEDIIEDSINGLDLSEWEQFLNSLSEDERALLPGDSATSLIEDIVQGKLDLSYDNVLEGLLSLLLHQFYKLLPFMLEITVLAILASVITNMQNSGQGVNEIIRFVLYALIALILCQSLFSLVSYAKNAVEKIGSLIQLATPILLALLISIGASSSAGVLQPDSAILVSGVGGILTTFVIPIILIMTVLVFLSNLSPRIKLDGVASLMRSVASWTMGIIFTIFAGVISIQGLAAASYDGVSLRAVKYAINTGIPIIGGMVGESMNMVLSCTLLIKNAVGIVSLLCMAGIMLAPCINIIAYIFMLKFGAAVLSPISEGNISNFFNQLADSLKLLLTAVCGMSIISIILIGIIIGAGNAAV